MKQVLQSFKDGELWLAEVPVPACKSNGIVMQTKVSFVSAGTERMLVDFAKKNIIGKALQMPDQVKKVIRKMKTEGIFETLEKVKNKLDQPIPLGYSCAGVVEEVGRNVKGLSKGDRVTCGGAGYANHSDYNYVPKNLVVKLPDNVSFEDASCATVGSIALQGVRQADLRLGETCCVMGLGLLGILAVQMLKASGVKVIGFDPNLERCKLAMEMGADLAVNSSLESAAMEFSQGYGVDAVIIAAATKSNEPVTVAGEIARMRGKVVVTGLVGMDLPRDQYYKKELDFKLSLSYGPGRYDSNYEEAGNDYPFGYVRWTEQRNIQAFIDMVAAGTVTPSKLVTHRFEIENALEAYDILLGKVQEPYLGITINYKDKELGDFSRTTSVQSAKSEVKSEKTDPAKPTVGFIGAGNFTKAVLFPNLKKFSDICLKSLCTATGMNCAETAKKEGFEEATTDYNELLKNSDINTVFVTTQHNSHAMFTSEALKAGKNVFVEKPLAITPKQLDGIVAVLEENPESRLMVGFNRRFSPHAELIKDYFASRTTPMLVTYRVNAGIIPPDVWIQDPEVGGGRIIGEACHFIDFASAIIGHDVVEVSATCVNTDNAQLIAEDNISINLKYSDGSVANIIYVAVGSSDLAKERCEIYADESVAVMDDFCSTKCMGKLGKKKLNGKQAKGFEEEIGAFLKSVESGSVAPIPVDSLINTTKVSFAALESVRSKSVVTI